MTEVIAAARAIADWPDVQAATQAALDACTALRWHEALRRRIPQAASESRLLGAKASASLEGATCTDADARRWWCDPRTAPVRDPSVAMVVSAMRAVAECEAVHTTVSSAPAHALARLHTAAGGAHGEGGAQGAGNGSGVSGNTGCDSGRGAVGRPRGEGDPAPSELLHLGAAPAGTQVSGGVAQLVELLSAIEVGAVVRSGLVHAEIARLRPFASHNGVVARALSRAVLWGGGADPTGVACVEQGCAVRGTMEYHGALAAYTAGTADGVRTWMVWWAQAVERGAHEGTRIADAVMRGRTQVLPK